VDIHSSDLPPLLFVNACVHEEVDYWADTRGSMMQPRINLAMDDGVPVEYEVRALIVQVAQKEELTVPHLVALVKIPEGDLEEDGGQWYLFNDFVVKPVSEEEALRFPGKWKVQYRLQLVLSPC